MDNSAACLFCDGTLVAAVENERLTRIKNDGSLPMEAIAEVLQTAGVAFADLDVIAVYWQPWRMGWRALGTARKLLGSPDARRAVIGRVGDMFSTASTAEDHSPSGWGDLLRLRSRLTSRFGKTGARFEYHDHHLTHQVYSEAMRDWNAFASLSYDGGGESVSTSLATVRGGKRTIISEHRWPNSLGHLYATFTGFLGFKMLEGEYKMMGLAPYGEPVYADAILEHVVRLEEGGRYQIDTRLCDYHAALKGQFPERMTALFGPPRQPDTEPTQDHINLATSVQHAFERVQQHILTPLAKSDPDLKRLVVSGGSALNVTANGRLLEYGQFEEIIIPPAPHDAGCAVGAALISVQRAKVAVDLASVRTPYLGTAYDDGAIVAAMDVHCSAPVECLDEPALLEGVARALADGLIVAWFQGHSEFGPRALGARSFLADPRRDEIREEINQKIKKRELFRPFAPSVIEEAASRFFELDQQSPYMNIVAKVRESERGTIPAVTHVDGTARVHTVSAAANPLYHALISKFGEITGVPVLLNTSFNIQEPIVQTPDGAFATFAASGVDVLAIGPYLVRREDLA